VNRWAAVARFGGIGDNLVASSVLRPLKRMGYMTEVITSPPYNALFLHNPFLDKLSVKVPERDLPKDSLEWQKWVESRSREYDVFFHASHSMEGRHSVFPNMTEFYLPEDYRRKRCAGNYIETAHDIIGVPYEFGPLFFASKEEKENALTVKKQVGECCILWVISGTRIDKMYPNAPIVIARIIKEIGAPVVVMGGPSEREVSCGDAIKEIVIQHNGNRDKLHFAIPANGGDKCWPVRTSLAFAQVCDLVITPDTGPAWAVAFEPNAKIALLSHGSAENVTKHWVNTTTLHADNNRVPCWPCHRLHNDISTCVPNKEGNGAACISDISVEQLVETVAKVWRANNNVIHAERVFSLAG
jgi:ADP-heptose:LPS heptosyltransferase